MKKQLLLLLSYFVLINPAFADSQLEQYRQWIQAMKQAERGPFLRIRWFCADGTVLPPKPYGCSEHGGGAQHGEYTEQTKTLRQQGYYIANILSGVDLPALIAEPNFNDRYNQLLIERFLRGADDGWILRKAQFYRGALQEEGERRSARKLLLLLSAKDEWLGLRYAGLYSGARLLAHGRDSASAESVREQAQTLSQQDKAFMPLRVKIHGSPDAGDAERVRQYAKNKKSPEAYLKLADDIDKLYQNDKLAKQLSQLSAKLTGPSALKQKLQTAATDFAKADDAQKLALTADVLASIRQQIKKVSSSESRLALLDLSLNIENEHLKAASRLRAEIKRGQRQQLLSYMQASLLASYGTGLINERSLQAAQEAMQKLNSSEIELNLYRQQLKYLGRVPGWASQSLRFQFYESMNKLAEIEPLAMGFIQNQLRSSALLFFSQNLDALSRDANQLAGIKHHVFGEDIDSGFHALNPGLARGTLHIKTDMSQLQDIKSDGIYVLPETVSDLPPLAGILTAGEGNPLSHVQLLARNLGIPNVTVDTRLIKKLAKYDGKKVVLAVSPSGLVELAADGPRWQTLFKQQNNKQVVIRPDLNKLDLSVRKFINLRELRAEDSGRIVGPKAAKLGELAHHYPDKVAKGLAIPFGLFRETVLDKSYSGTLYLGERGNKQQSVFDWMVDQYKHLQSLPANSTERAKQSEAFRSELYSLIANAEFSRSFVSQLKSGMQTTFASTELGVFVRSDTNVEDLPGFTGAGLNLTLPNVVGFENVLTAIKQVWASPFTERAFAWRQSHMQEPQHVYPAVLLLQSVANDKSGVMVTEDVDNGDRNTISVAVNEGVGGAVDGQSAESLRINMDSAKVKLLATASAPWRREPKASGGLEKLPVSGSQWVLKKDEINKLVEFAKNLPQHFPPIVDAKGNSAAADVEFGFLNGELHLFQLRPFLQNQQAQANLYLRQLDQQAQNHPQQHVNMQRPVNHD
ncbi:PEP/pyruvate-binding domain-containing protein [Agaribacterium haliotis]|uniref:PEP/pyruvate-binding domain-containing protein n=1 Tax=Agaribacterium haliotis TaxID=2013869 RepID=UPI000BB53072|nr:PEP/pyruvate-binding domain-containing protein [Agaribacterium haliotis]